MISDPVSIQHPITGFMSFTPRYSKLSELYRAAQDWSEDQWAQGTWETGTRHRGYKRCLLGHLSHVMFGHVEVLQYGGGTLVEPYVKVLAQAILDSNLPYGCSYDSAHTCMNFNDSPYTRFEHVQMVLKKAEVIALRMEAAEEGARVPAPDRIWRFPVVPVDYNQVVDWQLAINEIEVTTTKVAALV